MASSFDLLLSHPDDQTLTQAIADGKHFQSKTYLTS